MKYLLIFFCLFFSNSSKAGYRGSAFYVAATEKYLPILPYALARVTIDYANSDKILRKPVIVFEGFDPGFLTDPNIPIGKKGIEDFIYDLRNDVEPPLTTQLQQMLNGSLLAPFVGQQYDLVWVDWVNGTDYLQNNMYAAMRVIEWVNTNKAPVSGAKLPNVVLGKSMGSLIARMALKTFEDRFASTAYRHHSRLYAKMQIGCKPDNQAIQTGSRRGQCPSA